MAKSKKRTSNKKSKSAAHKSPAKKKAAAKKHKPLKKSHPKPESGSHSKTKKKEQKKQCPIILFIVICLAVVAVGALLHFFYRNDGMRGAVVIKEPPMIEEEPEESRVEEIKEVIIEELNPIGPKIASVKERLDTPNYYVALSDDIVRVKAGEKYNMAFGYENTRDLSYFYTSMTYSNFNEKAAKYGPDVIIEDWFESLTTIEQVQYKERKIIPFKLTVPKGQQKGRYTFFLNVCYFIPDATYVEPGCSEDQPKIFSRRQKLYVDVI
ncbi:MAG: hypothetical protein KKF44_05750 [Nanoarchaeota archaeon]|nr:hypothetical protein [Nanoarchaeota archaeon]